MEPVDIKHRLRQCELFSVLTEEELSSLAKLGSVEEYAAGDIIYEQGQPGEKFYVLDKGQVSLLRHYKLGQRRMADITVYVLRERPLRKIMGCWCTLIGEEHVQMCTARCDRPSKVISIACSDLRENMAKNSNMRIKILEELVLILRDRLKSSYESMETL